MRIAPANTGLICYRAILPKRYSTRKSKKTRITDTPIVAYQKLMRQAGFAYGVQTSTNLASTNWVDIAELINTNGAVQFFDQDSANYPMRFYRAYVPIKQ